jgi:hypothetical protein
VASRRWLLLALPVAVACRAGGAADGDGDAFQDLAELVPASAVTEPEAMLQYVDMDLVWGRMDVGDDADERLDSLGRTAQLETYAIPPRLFGNMTHLVEDARAEVGFDVTVIRQEIAVDDPPRELRIARVAVDDDTVEDALADDPVWSADQETVETDAGSYFDWSGGEEDQIDPSRRTPMRPLGIGGQLAVEAEGDETLVTRTEQAALMESALATAAGDEPSLADEGLLAPAIEQLVGDGDVVQALGLIGALRVDPAQLAGGDDAMVERLEQQLEGDAAIEPYEALLAAELVDGDQYRSQLLVVHADAQAAGTNVGAIRRRLDEGVSFATGEPLAELLPTESIEQDGAIVRITFADGVSFRRPVQALLTRDILATLD